MDVQCDVFLFLFSGIDVGDQFYSRAEMVVLGIHSHWLNGIDYMGMKYQGKVLSKRFCKTLFQKNNHRKIEVQLLDLGIFSF